STESKPARNCADKDGKLDKECKCRETKSCFQINTKDLNFGPSTHSISEAIGLGESVADANKVMRGELSASELNQKALASRLNKLSKVKDDLTSKLNTKLAADGKTPINVDDKYIRDYVAKNIPKSAYETPTARRAASLLLDSPASEYAPQDKELSEKLK